MWWQTLVVWVEFSKLQLLSPHYCLRYFHITGPLITLPSRGMCASVAQAVVLALSVLINVTFFQLACLPGCNGGGLDAKLTVFQLACPTDCNAGAQSWTPAVWDVSLTLVIHSNEKTDSSSVFASV